MVSGHVITTNGHVDAKARMVDRARHEVQLSEKTAARSMCPTSQAVSMLDYNNWCARHSLSSRLLLLISPRAFTRHAASLVSVSRVPSPITLTVSEEEDSTKPRVSVLLTFEPRAITLRNIT